MFIVGHAVSDVLYRNNLIGQTNKEELCLYGHPSLSSVNQQQFNTSKIHKDSALNKFLRFPPPATSHPPPPPPSSKYSE